MEGEETRRERDPSATWPPPSFVGVGAEPRGFPFFFLILPFFPFVRRGVAFLFLGAGSLEADRGRRFERTGTEGSGGGGQRLPEWTKSLAVAIGARPPRKTGGRTSATRNMGTRSPVACDNEICDVDSNGPQDDDAPSPTITVTTTTTTTTTTTAAAGASVLCYAVAPHTGELFFLLGKESGGAADARLDYDNMGPPTSMATPVALSPPPRPKDGGIVRALSAAVGSCNGDDKGECALGHTRLGVGEGCIHANAINPQDGAIDGDEDTTLNRQDGRNLAGAPMEAAGSARRARRTHRWCDFGGRIEPGETQEEAAAREFFEETLGLVCTDSCSRSAHRAAAMGSVDVGARPGTHGDADREALAADLAAGRYSLRVRTCLNHGAEAAVPRRYHVTFVKRIPWTPGVVLQFARLRCELAAIARAARRHHPYAAADDGTNNNDDNNDDDNTTSTFMARSCCKHDDDNNDKGDGDDGGGNRNGDGEAHDKSRHGCNRGGVYTGDEPAARAALDPHGRVRAECIEKDYLQFWSVRRLRQALDNGGCFRREHLRPLFMPTIAVVLDVMAPRRDRPAAPLSLVADSGGGGGGSWRSATRVTVDRTAGAGVYTVHCKTIGRRYSHYRHASQRDHTGDDNNSDNNSTSDPVDDSDRRRDSRAATDESLSDESSLSDECDCPLLDDPCLPSLASAL
ncbi:MutT/NUDIX hydrolase [Pandoravirus inopinatum]|uniref:NUDIX hydrolase domain-like motif-containing protein n=1 Tax=Pandoravirus inopinatum TaxID=1605721 RepID=A0A0B5JE62_9VIRU|nr:MutT/NUDIX hydrolase [Pandoravirus inopinatum]AJF98057.1 NUDIX hydrolase domain-like motif-containing protein [Pandoravirus inopinatum]